MRLKAIGTTLNEHIFATMRGLVVTPDNLEFTMAFPKVVDEFMKQASILPFIYHTRGHNFYEKIKGCMAFEEIPKLQPHKASILSQSDMQLLLSFRRNFAAGLRVRCTNYF